MKRQMMLPVQPATLLSSFHMPLQAPTEADVCAMPAPFLLSSAATGTALRMPLVLLREVVDG